MEWPVTSISLPVAVHSLIRTTSTCVALNRAFAQGWALTYYTYCESHIFPSIWPNFGRLQTSDYRLHLGQNSVLVSLNITQLRLA